MEIYLHHHHHFDEELARALLSLLVKQGEKIMADLTQLQADVAAETTVTQSAITLLQGLKQQLEAAGTDPQKLADLSASIEANTKALSDAITSNTPAATAPETPPSA